jgi:phosphatidylserine/phosphatidylglycerophosphate/cardiolipin synthase-like enzyme
VKISVIVETPDELEGENEYSTLRALGDDVAACSAVYWPKDKRGRDDSGKLGILHVKCAVADGRWLFLSSANLTEYAFTINRELGVLVTGGSLPGQVQEHFDRLIANNLLCRVYLMSRNCRPPAKSDVEPVAAHVSSAHWRRCCAAQRSGTGRPRTPG